MSENQKPTTNKKVNPNDRNGVENIKTKKESKKNIASRGITMSRGNFTQSTYNKETKKVTYKTIDIGATLYAVDEDNILKVTVKAGEKEPFLVDEKGFKVNFIDMLFEDRNDAKRYIEAPFM